MIELLTFLLWLLIGLALIGAIYWIANLALAAAPFPTWVKNIILAIIVLVALIFFVSFMSDKVPGLGYTLWSTI